MDRAELSCTLYSKSIFYFGKSIGLKKYVPVGRAYFDLAKMVDSGEIKGSELGDKLRKLEEYVGKMGERGV